jgi:hypothetical protein
VFPLPLAQNPADYILLQIGAGLMNKSRKDWGQIWSQTEERRLMEDTLSSIVDRHAAAVRASGGLVASL